MPSSTPTRSRRTGRRSSTRSRSSDPSRRSRPGRRSRTRPTGCSRRRTTRGIGSGGRGGARDPDARPVRSRRDLMVAGDRRVLWLMASPFLLGVIALVLLPAFGSLVMSFFEWDLVRPPRFVGSANLRELFGDPVFLISLRNSLALRRRGRATPPRGSAGDRAGAPPARSRADGRSRRRADPERDARRRLRADLAVDPQPALRAAQPGPRGRRPADAVMALARDAGAVGRRRSWGRSSSARAP